MSSTLPPTHKALIQEIYGEPLVIKTLSTPQITPGSVIIKVLCAPIASYLGNVYNGKRKYPYQTPLITGTSAIGIVTALGADAVLLKEGDLVYFDFAIHGRDDPDTVMLMGLIEGMTEGSRKLMKDEWRNGPFAEYVKVPLENVFVLDQKRLTGRIDHGGLGYSLEQLTWIQQALVPYGGLKSIGLQPGETIIISPATGGYGSAAVSVALAMGAAKVICIGRNVEALEKLKSLGSRVEIVQITGIMATEIAAIKKFGRIDAYLDISPPEAKDSTHFKSSILSLAPHGRVCLMGGLLDDLAIPHRFIVRFDITVKGKWMYSRDDIQSFMRLLTSGLLNMTNSINVLGTFKIEDWKEAFEVASSGGRLGDTVAFVF